jgi:hypothetical protein
MSGDPILTTLKFQFHSGQLCYLKMNRVEVPITDYLRDYAPNLEKYKAVQIAPCRKIEIMRTAIFLVIMFLKLKLL